MEAMQSIRFIASAFFYVALHLIGFTLLIGVAAFHLYAPWPVIAALVIAHVVTVVPYHEWALKRIGL